MSTRTAYRRSGEFGATRTARKAGLSYEAQVHQALLALLSESSEASERRPGPALEASAVGEQAHPLTLRSQFPRNGGRVDFAILGPQPLFLIEVKAQWSHDAHLQLLRYAGSELSAVSRVCICKTYHPHIKIAEQVQCSPLDDLLLAPRGRLTIIPWARRKRL